MVKQGDGMSKLLYVQTFHSCKWVGNMMIVTKNHTYISVYEVTNVQMSVM